MDQKFDYKIIIEELRELIRKYFPYFLSSYIFAFAISIFSPYWSKLFYWPAFNFLVILFAILYLAGQKNLNLKKVIRVLILPAWSVIKELTLRAYDSFIGLKKISRYKILAITIIFLYFFLTGVRGLDLLVILFALVSVLFTIDSRIAGAVALIFIAFCPLLLSLKRDGWAQDSAVYAFYFLVITVVTQIRELSYYDKRELEKAKDSKLT